MSAGPAAATPSLLGREGWCLGGDGRADTACIYLLASLAFALGKTAWDGASDADTDTHLGLRDRLAGTGIRLQRHPAVRRSRKLSSGCTTSARRRHTSPVGRAAVAAGHVAAGATRGRSPTATVVRMAMQCWPKGRCPGGARQRPAQRPC